MLTNREYLGDAVYACQDEDAVEGYLILYTSNGIEDTNMIYLEPEVVEKLLKYINKVQNEG